MSGIRTRLALLGLVAAAAACSQHYDLPVHAPVVAPTDVTFSWEGDPARTVTVYRCAEACPPVSTLPNLRDEADPKPGKIVWELSGVGSPADGAGTIEKPLSYGDADHPKATVATPPAELVPGHYLVRVVTFKGVQMKARVGTGWSTFTVPGPGSGK